MPSYRVSFTVCDYNIGHVRKKAVKAFGEAAGVAVDKVQVAKSRADRLSEAESMVSDAKSEVESLRDELNDWKDNLPENLQSGQKADELDEAISALEEIESQLDQCDFSNVNFPGMY